MTAPAAQPTQPTTNPLAKLATVSRDNITDMKGSVLYCGEPGTGKSEAAFSWPTPIIAAYFDRNFDTVRRLIQGGKDIQLVVPQSWAEWENVFVPAVANRQLEAATIVVDSVDALTKAILWPEIQGQRPKLAIQDFGTGLTRMQRTIDQLVSSTRPIPGKRSYHVVCTTHLTDMTDDDGVLRACKPSMMGAFKDVVGELFDLVLWNRAQLSSKTVRDPNTQANTTVPEKSYFVWTISPDNFHTCKAPSYMPPRMDGRYEALWAAWHPEAKVNE